MKFRPLGDRVIIKGGKAVEKIGSILIPETSQRKPSQGTVLAVGEGRWTDKGLQPLTVKPGDQVMFNEWTGTEMTIENQKVLVVKQDEIVGVIS